MANLPASYLEASNGVLAVNYYGEVLTVELISTLLRKKTASPYRDLLTRQLLDETRHANITRKLLLERGRDPMRDDTRADFTFHELFKDFGARSYEEVLAFLGENESISSRNFSDLIKIAKHAGDEQLTSLYSEILNDEVQHSKHIFNALPQNDADLLAIRKEAQEKMSRMINPRYLELFVGFEPR